MVLPVLPLVSWESVFLSYGIFRTGSRDLLLSHWCHHQNSILLNTNKVFWGRMVVKSSWKVMPLPAESWTDTIITFPLELQAFIWLKSRPKRLLLSLLLLHANCVPGRCCLLLLVAVVDTHTKKKNGPLIDINSLEPMNPTSWEKGVFAGSVKHLEMR